MSSSGGGVDRLGHVFRWMRKTDVRKLVDDAVHAIGSLGHLTPYAIPALRDKVRAKCTLDHELYLFFSLCATQLPVRDLLLRMMGGDEPKCNAFLLRIEQDLVHFIRSLSMDNARVDMDAPVDSTTIITTTNHFACHLRLAYLQY